MSNMNIKRLEQRLINTNLNKNNSIKPAKKDFSEILGSLKESKEIKFSKHAKERLVSRNINLNNQDLVKLNSALQRAEEKGVKDALILMKDQAFIANINNRTIITAVEQEKLRENVFTNIDGAVII